MKHVLWCAWLFLLGAKPLAAEEVYRVEAGKGGSVNARLERLERAVDQLQRKVFALENAPPAKSTEPSCFIETPFDGTFRAAGADEASARASVLKACREKTKSALYCEEREVKCGK